MFVMLFKSVHPIIVIHCDTRYVDILKVASIPVSLFCISQYGDASCIIPSLLGMEVRADGEWIVG